MKSNNATPHVTWMFSSFHTCFLHFLLFIHVFFVFFFSCMFSLTRHTYTCRRGSILIHPEYRLLGTKNARQTSSTAAMPPTAALDLMRSFAFSLFSLCFHCVFTVFSLCSLCSLCSLVYKRPRAARPGGRREPERREPELPTFFLSFFLSYLLTY